MSSTTTELSSNPPVDSVDGMSNGASLIVSAAVKNNSKFLKTTEDIIYPMKEQPHGWCLMMMIGFCFLFLFLFLYIFVFDFNLIFLFFSDNRSYNSGYYFFE